MFRNRWLRRIVVTLTVLVVVVAVTLIFIRNKAQEQGRERLRVAVADTDAVDPQWRLEDLDAARGTLPDDENSALLVPRYKAALASPNLMAMRPDKTEVLGDIISNRRLDAEGIAAVDQALTGNDAALAVARSFRNYPRGLRRYQITPDVIGTLLPDVQESRQIAMVLDLEAERLSIDGRHGAALQLVPAMLNVGRSMEGEPFFISALVRIAIDSMAVRRTERTLGLGVPAGGLADLQAVLLREADADVFFAPLRGERACLDRMFVNMRSGQVSVGSIVAMSNGGPGSPSSIKAQVAGWAYRPFLANDHAVCLETLNQYCAAAQLPDHRQRAALQAVPLPSKTQGSLLSALLVPAINKMHDASLRHRAVLRCAAIAIAVERYRQEHGRWPDTLAEIPKKILPAIPLDPYDGQPLRFVGRADGVTIYSIGTDEVDNGGNVSEKWSDWNKPGFDMGIRLFDPQSRGLPAIERSEPGEHVPAGVSGGSRPGPANWQLPPPREVQK
jgi:hypothetical protein